MNSITHLTELSKKKFPKQYSAASKLVKAKKSKAQSMISGLPKKYIREADLYLSSNTAPPMLKNLGSYPSRAKQIYDISPEVLQRAKVEAEILRKNKLQILRNAYQNGVVFN